MRFCGTSRSIVVEVEQGVAVVAVQSPVAPADSRMRLKIGDKGGEPLPFGARVGAGKGELIVRGAELTDPDRGKTGFVFIAPLLLKCAIRLEGVARAVNQACWYSVGP